MTPTLRPVVAADGPLLRALAVARRPELHGLPEPLVAMQAEAQRRDYAARFPGAEESIVVDAGRPVGRLWVYRGDDHWRVLDVVLLADARGAGIGTSLLTALVADADRADVPVRLTVDAAGNPARALYERLGFAAAGSDGVGLVMERPPRPRAGLPATG